MTEAPSPLVALSAPLSLPSPSNAPSFPSLPSHSNVTTPYYYILLTNSTMKPTNAATFLDFIEPYTSKDTFEPISTFVPSTTSPTVVSVPDENISTPEVATYSSSNSSLSYGFPVAMCGTIVVFVQNLS